MQAVYEAADLLPEDNLSRIEGFKALERCVNLLDLRRPGSAECFESMENGGAGAGRYLLCRQKTESGDGAQYRPYPY